MWEIFISLCLVGSKVAFVCISYATHKLAQLVAPRIKIIFIMHDDVSTCNDAFIAAVVEIIAPKCIKTTRMENNARYLAHDP